MSSGDAALGELSDAELVEAALRATDHLPQTAAARALGVSQVSVSRWRAGERRELWTVTRRKLEAYLLGARGAADEPVMDWLRDFEKVVLMMDEKNGGLPAEERRARKLDLVSGMIEVRKRRGADAPAMLYALLRRIENGEL